jgi:hypothetical protein
MDVHGFRNGTPGEVPWIRVMIALSSAVLLTLLLASCSASRSYEAALLLADIAAMGAPSRLKDQTPPPERRMLQFMASDQVYNADLYHPAEQPLASLLLVPGAAPEGRHDPRLMAFAMSMARARFLVLVPDLAGLRRLEVRPHDARQLADIFDYLVSHGEWTPGGPAGICAFSYAVGPALLASLDRRIRDRVSFVLAVGGYYDLVEVLTYFTTGYFRERDHWRHNLPDPYAKWLFVRSNLERIDNPKERALFQSITEQKLKDPESALDEFESQLGPQGRSLYVFITNSDPAQTPQLVQELPPSIQEDIRGLDLANKDLTQLKAHLILVHGRDDNVIPYTQSIALANALPRSQAALFLLNGLAHVDLRPGLIAGWQWWRATYALLTQRDLSRARRP